MRTPPTPVSVLVAARVLPCFTVGRARSAWEALMRRREFIALIGGVAAWPLSSANAQARVRRMVFLASTPAAEILDLLGAFREALREHGYREGQNITLEFPWPQGLPEEAELSTALPRLKVDLILAWGTPAVMAARRATSTLPIIMVGVADPVGSGVVASLARPGGNVTGISTRPAAASFWKSFSRPCQAPTTSPCCATRPTRPRLCSCRKRRAPPA